MIHHIEHYTGNYNAALNCGVASAGDTMTVIEYPDGREWDDFSRQLRKNGLVADFSHSAEDGSLDYYDINEDTNREVIA